MQPSYPICKYSVQLDGHKTSISLEPEFWNELKIIALKKNMRVSELISTIDHKKNGNLSSTLRVYILMATKGQEK